MIKQLDSIRRNEPIAPSGDEFDEDIENDFEDDVADGDCFGGEGIEEDVRSHNARFKLPCVLRRNTGY